MVIAKQITDSPQGEEREMKSRLAYERRTREIRDEKRKNKL